MAIKGLTDRGLSFPEIGQLRKGAAKAPGSDRPGQDLNYFRVTFDEKEVETERIFRSRYGDQPQEINIILPFDDLDRTWEAHLEAYSAGRMIARSDGEYYSYLVDYKTGEILVKSGIDIKTKLPRGYHEGEPVGYWKNRKTGKDEPIVCRPVGRLKVIIPELARAVYLTVLTTSVHDILNISEQLEALKRINNGRIAGIPMVLRRRPKKISTPSADGTRARREKWLISIEADPEWVKRMLTVTKRLALPGNGLALLPEGTHAAGGPDDDELIETTSHVVDDEEDWYPPSDDDSGEPPDIVVEPTVQEPELKSQPVSKSQPAPGTNGKRPYSPDMLRKRIQLAVAEALTGGVKPKETDRMLLAANLESCFAGEADSKERRKTVMMFLLGKTSTKDLTDSEVLALKRWLDAKPDSGGVWEVNALSAQEAHAVYREALKAEGQEELPF